MILRGRLGDRALTLNTKPNCLTLSLESRDGTEVYSFDGEGRLWTALVDSVSYRRGLDGKVVAKRQINRESRDRRWLAIGEVRQLEACARDAAASLARAVFDTPLPPPAVDGLERAKAFDAARAEADVARYHQVYKPVGILPPDQYMAVVLQITEGCSFNTCTYCSFYKDRPFRIKSVPELREHALAVRSFLGRGLSLRRTIFLGDANALVAPMKQLLPLLDVVGEVFDVEALGGLFAFLDGFSAERKSAGDYRELARRGLKRVYVGLESGNDVLLQFLRKPGAAADAVKAVHTLKSAGVAVGVIVLLGAGGRTHAEAHVRDTVRAIDAMRLDAGDLLYLSELVVDESMPYARAAVEAGVQPLSPEQRAAQGKAVEESLRFSAAAGAPHISRYDIREFVY